MLNISGDTREFAENFVEDFIERIQTLRDVKKYTKSELILYISEVIGTRYESESIIVYCNNLIENVLIENVIEEIENSKLELGGMYSDFGIFTFAVNNIFKKTGSLYNLSFKLNTILLDYAISIMESQKQRILLASDYDCISGISGILYYLLHTDFKKLDKIKLQKLIEFLINCTKVHEYKKCEVINFHLEKKRLILRRR